MTLSRGQLAAIVMLGTFAFALVLAGGLSLAESEEGEKKTVLLDQTDPEAWIAFIALIIRVVGYTFEWKYENRVGLSLMWSGIACALGAVICALW